MRDFTRSNNWRRLKDKAKKEGNVATGLAEYIELLEQQLIALELFIHKSLDVSESVEEETNGGD